MTTIELKNISFSYSNNTPVFIDHSLTLEVPQDQQVKLYGIIGPSGTGKTTLLSILGGQLNPKGEVIINGTNIYQVDDNVRRELLSMQLQTSTSLRGKLNYNLVFGLPEDTDIEKEGNQPLYSDNELIDLLEKVGLWNIFEDKEGLDTLIGEGGLNLSGGQRQRLNFASLYLRSQYYKPSLILIDEPTSSLDEISERAITQMIDEMASKAVVFVVAHRLKTLDTAVGLLDTSLLEDHKEMKFMSIRELKQTSRYYDDLLTGKAVLDD